MIISKNNLTFLTLIGASFVGLFAITTAVIKSFTSSFDYLSRLCSHIYDGGQRILLTLQNFPANPLTVALGILLFFGLIWASFILAKQIKETRQLTKRILTANFKSLPAAFCHGLIRQSIFLNQTLLKKLSPAEIQAVVLHEEYHLKNFDNLKVLIARFLAKFLFFLPFIKNLSEDYESQKEFAADYYAAKKLGAPTVAAALCRLLEISPERHEENLLIGGFAGAADRIEQLLGQKPKKANLPLPSWLASFLIIFLIVLSLFQKPLVLAQNQMLMPTEKPNAACNSSCIPYIHPQTCSIPKNNP